MMTDIEIAQQCVMKPITEIAATAHVDEKYLEQYGRYKAKIDLSLLRESKRPDGKLILVTAITPTPAGEGKTTTTIGLADGLRRIGKDVTVALREPSLGPVFGIKGGAAGGGWAQVVPMEDINLHFTGDFHAIGAANNLLAAMLDNHIQQGNALGIDPRRITWKRCVDMNDRQLRSIVDGLGGKVNGTPREDGFDITVASEIMAVLCLATSITDLKERLARMIVGYTYGDEPVTCGQLHAQGAMTALLKDAIKPNLVQTLEGTPAFVHGGPFANIAHGCNSVIATKMALKMGDYTVTEALYAQIKYLLNKPGYQYWFTQSENSRIEENNEDFIFHSPEEELVLTHIRKPERFEKVHYLTVTEIAELIRERTGYQYSHGTKAQLGKVMSKHGFEFHKGKNGRRYTVFIIDTEQVKSNRLYE